MKILKGQKHSYWTGQTLVSLDGLLEANSLVKAALGKPSFLKKNTMDCLLLLQANRRYETVISDVSYNEDYKNRFIARINAALDAIENGNPAVEAAANALCEKLVHLAHHIEPSLSLEKTFTPAEDGEVFDAGKIAAGEAIAFFDKTEGLTPKQAHGGGAYRILINTDVYWAGDPTAQCAALMALVVLLQRNCPVEIWIQQGWMGNDASDGVTIFKIFEGSQVTARQLYFWIGSPYKDNPYSFVVNRCLKRTSHATSGPPEIPCDLYIYGPHMPKIAAQEGEEPDDAIVKWIAGTAKPLLFDEELPSGWCGYGTTIEGMWE